MKLVLTFCSMLTVFILVSLLSYGMSQNSDSFHWAMLNPMEAVENILFFLSFGFGVPVWIAVILIIVLLLLLWRGFYLLFVRLFLRNE